MLTSSLTGSDAGALVVTWFETAICSPSVANWYTCRPPQPLLVAVVCSAGEGRRDDRTKLMTSVAPVSASSAVMPAPEPLGRTTGFELARSTDCAFAVVLPAASPVASNENTRRAGLVVLNPES